jgi:hypothetical protein
MYNLKNANINNENYVDETKDSDESLFCISVIF